VTASRSHGQTHVCLFQPYEQDNIMNTFQLDLFLSWMEKETSYLHSECYKKQLLAYAYNLIQQPERDTFRIPSCSET